MKNNNQAIKYTTKPIKRITYLLLFTLGLSVFSTGVRGQSTPLKGQHKYYIIELTTKKGTPYQLSKPETFLSPKAIARKLQFKIPIDSTDLPVNPAFLNNIAALDLTIINSSRWMNQVFVKSTNEAIVAELSKFSFVKRCLDFSATTNPVIEAKSGRSPSTTSLIHSSSEVVMVNNSSEKSTNNIIQVPADDTLLQLNGDQLPTNVLDYGKNAPQVQIHQGAYLHNAGFTGKGILIAVLDAGFKGYKTNSIFDSLNIQNRVLKEWDFVENESGVNEDDVHGMQCLSTLAANKPGTMIGTAPHADYLLFRTENAAHEMPYEEHTWLVAAEAADSAGADLITSSLGYVAFDNNHYSYSYAERDGSTSLISRAAKIAVTKGILVVNSAGNNGNQKDESRYISCPGDVAQVFTVGAVNVMGAAAGFSSIGPAYGGQIKPNVVSVGAAGVIANQSGSTTTGNGTSISAPNLAGLMACLWQAFPKATNMEIMDAVQKTADKYLTPNEKYGYGLPDFKLAAELLQREETKKNYEHILGRSNIKAYPVPFLDELHLSFLAPTDGNINIRLIDVNGKHIENQMKLVKKDQYYTVHFKGLSNLQSGVYYVQTLDGKNNTMLPVMKQ